MKKRIAIFCTLLLLCWTASANVIFPAFSAAYVSVILLPVALLAVLIVESIAYKWQCRSLSIGIILVAVVVVNAISWLAGIAITSYLPSGLIDTEQGIVTGGPNFPLYAILGFLIAYVLSVFIEGTTLKVLARRLGISSPFMLSLIANTGSYLVLSVLVWVMK